MRVCLCEGTLRFGFLHSGLGSRVSGLVSGSSSLSIPERLTMRRMVKGRSPRLDTRDTCDHMQASERQHTLILISAYLDSL